MFPQHRVHAIFKGPRRAEVRDVLPDGGAKFESAARRGRASRAVLEMAFELEVMFKIEFAIEIAVD